MNGADSMSKSYPDIASKNWHELRGKFKRTVPTEVTIGYLTTSFGMNQNTAKKFLRQLAQVGLLSEDGHPTELAYRWRDDEQYAAVCKEILEAVYPEELRHAAASEQAAAERWFQNVQHLGLGAAQNVARTYALIASGDLNLADKKKQSGAQGDRAEARKTQRRDKERAQRPARAQQAGSGQEVPGSFGMPQPQIAVQVNISPGMKPDEIDQVFASMAKYFYGGVVG